MNAVAVESMMLAADVFATVYAETGDRRCMAVVALAAWRIESGDWSEVSPDWIADKVKLIRGDA